MERQTVRTRNVGTAGRSLKLTAARAAMCRMSSLSIEVRVYLVKGDKSSPDISTLSPLLTPVQLTKVASVNNAKLIFIF